MSRRVVATAALAATAMLSTGIVPLLGSAHADACAAWTDPADDAKPMGQKEVPLPGLDIVGAALETAGTDIVATVKVSDLTEDYTATGDHFAVYFTVGAKTGALVAERAETGDTARVTDTAAAAAEPATAEFDFASNTVTITAPRASIEKVVGSEAYGSEATGLIAATYVLVGGKPIIDVDSTETGNGLKFVVGTACDTPRAPLVIPDPAPDCTPNFTDGPNDGTPKGPGDVSTGNDGTLDVLSVVLNSTAQHLMAYIKVSALADKPSNYQGDRYQIGFKAGAKSYTYSVGRPGLGRSLNMASPTGGAVDGTANDKLKVRGVFDKPKNTVVIVIDRPSLDAVHGSAISDGTTLTNVLVTTAGAQPGMYLPADTAQATTETDRVYQIGNNPCFGPPKTKLLNVGDVTAQFTDAASVGAKLTTEAGEALAGKTVRFELGALSATAVTDAAGVAEAKLASSLAAGSYNLVATFAGDAAGKRSTLTTPFTISPEKTKITLTVVKSGTKRTVTAKLLDDDGKPVVGVPVAWTVNNKAAGAPKTNGSGIVTLTSAAPTQTVKATFAAVTGKYAGATASVKV